MKEEDRQRVWRLYGWFSGLMCVGSVFGAITWAAWMQFLVLFFKSFAPGLLNVQFQSLNAQAQYWVTAFYLAYAIEFLCLTVAKLMVLDRMADFLAKSNSLSRRLAVGGRVVMAAVVVGNVVGLCGNVASAVFAKESGDLYSAAGAAFAANNTDGGRNFNKLAIKKLSYAEDVASVQQFCEVTVLLIIIAAFAVVGIASFRRVSSALGDLFMINDDRVRAAAATGRQMQRQILGTTACVFVTFLLRAVFSIMNAVSNLLQNVGAACGDPNLLNLCDPSCFNVWDLMQWWLQFTPELQLTVVLISSPLALIVALWGMTSERMLQHMKSDHKQMVSLPGQVSARLGA